MTTIYFNCCCGVSGDMIVGSLLDLGADSEYLLGEIAKLGLSGYTIKIEKVDKKGVQATRFVVQVEGEQPPRFLPDIYKIIDQSTISDSVNALSKQIFLELARAEAHAHNKSITEVHFHEIGAVDSIIDIVSAAVLLTGMEIKYASCSTISLGCGRTRTAHGVFDVPVPAVRQILKDAPTKRTKIQAELTTPTGAAIIKTITKKYTDKLPSEGKKGYGAGSRDLEVPNVLEAWIEY